MNPTSAMNPTTLTSATAAAATPAIRLAREDDAAAVARIYAPSITDRAISFEATPPDAAELAARIRRVAAYAPWLVCEAAGDVWGYAYASHHRERAAYRWAIDVSVYIAARYHRRGVGRALYTSLLALVRLQGFYTAHAGIALPNSASVGLHESLGFTPTGVYRAVGFTLGSWHDVGWWQLALRAPSDKPAEPRTPAALAADPRWDAALVSGLPQLGRP
jgi:L-amino acid N-acyltransferase YncA